MNQTPKSETSKSRNSKSQKSASHAVRTQQVGTDIVPWGSKYPRIAVISAAWHREIVGNGKLAIQTEFERCRIPAEHVQYFEVPGALEIPLHAKRLAESGKFDGIIACALIVNGGIYRHEFVSTAVIDGMMRVQLDSNVPIFSAVLTPINFHECVEHQHFFEQHFLKKGTEVAQACLQTIYSLRNMRESLGG
jgi:6,7-dimethyl-8-ribityllumazine synthase